MPAIGDWAVALILLAISFAVIAVMALVCRLLGVWRFTSLFASTEETSALTKSEQYNGYQVTSPPSGGFRPDQGYVQYDTIREDPRYLSLGESQDAETPPPAADVRGESPVSVDEMSVASDYEPPGGLQRAMSCESVASDSSVMDIQPDTPKIGQLEFGLDYDRDANELVVSVIQARDLEESAVTGTLDSYVKLWLTPHKKGKVQTKVQKGTIHPVFKERFLWAVYGDELDNKTVQFQVFSCDKYARHKLLGETELRLGDIDIRQAIRVWMNLRDMDQKPTDLGDVMFSLSYLPTAERLTIVVVKARNLSWSNPKEGGGDCFIKVYLLQNGKKVGKKKTSVKRGEKNPIFNEAMIFSVPATALATVQLRLSVIEQLPEGKLASIGHVIVGSTLSGTELTHWNQMMTSLRKPIAMWHSLRKR